MKKFAKTERQPYLVLNSMFCTVCWTLQGHDTTAAGSSFVLCLLGIYHDIQDKVYNELYNIFGDSDRPVNFADTLEMKYLERVILETLRLYPPVPIIARNLNSDVKIGNIFYHFNFRHCKYGIQLIFASGDCYSITVAMKHESYF